MLDECFSVPTSIQTTLTPRQPYPSNPPTPNLQKKKKELLPPTQQPKHRAAESLQAPSRNKNNRWLSFSLYSASRSARDVVVAGSSPPLYPPLSLSLSCSLPSLASLSSARGPRWRGCSAVSLPRRSRSPARGGQ